MKEETEISRTFKDGAAKTSAKDKIQALTKMKWYAIAYRIIKDENVMYFKKY